MCEGVRGNFSLLRVWLGYLPPSQQSRPMRIPSSPDAPIPAPAPADTVGTEGQKKSKKRQRGFSLIRLKKGKI